MELQKLKYLVAVADRGTVSAAAHASLITQPALSRQIHSLERELGIDLFDRRRGRLELNAAGRAFLPAARDVLQRAEDARILAESLSAGRLARLSIGAPTTTLGDVVAPFLATLRAGDPVPTVLEVEPGKAELAIRREADLVIITEPPGDSLESMPVAVLPVWVYVRRDDPWASLQSIDLATLCRRTVAVPSINFKARQLFDAICTIEGVRVDLLDCRLPQAAQAAAAADRGVAVVSDDPRFDLTGLRLHSHSGPVEITLWAGWAPGHHGAASLIDMVTRLQDFCANQYGEQTRPRGFVLEHTD